LRRLKTILLTSYLGSQLRQAFHCFSRRLQSIDVKCVDQRLMALIRDVNSQSFSCLSAQLHPSRVTSSIFCVVFVNVPPSCRHRPRSSMTVRCTDRQLLLRNIHFISFISHNSMR